MTPTLDQIKDRAQRHLDGMKVNTDAMARDVIKLCDAIAAAQARAHKQPFAAQGGFAERFEEIFGDIFRGKP